jgi:cytoskeletal protein RodZ
MERFKRGFALFGACLLIFLYIVTFILAIGSHFHSEICQNWLMASIVATVLIPIFMYAFQMMSRILSEQGIKMRAHEEAFLRSMKEQMEQEQKEDNPAQTTQTVQKAQTDQTTQAAQTEQAAQTAQTTQAAQTTQRESTPEKKQMTKEEAIALAKSMSEDKTQK